MKRWVFLLILFMASILGANFYAGKWRGKYEALRKIYNETVISFIQTQIGKMPKEELDRLRVAVEKSEPKFITETAVDLGVMKDKAGEWRVKS